MFRVEKSNKILRQAKISKRGCRKITVLTIRLNNFGLDKSQVTFFSTRNNRCTFLASDDVYLQNVQ